MTIEELNKIKKRPTIISRFLYKYFGIETKEYKRWWKYYSKCINIMLQINKITTN